MTDPMTTMFGPKHCRKCGRDHYKGACPEKPTAATVVLHPALESERERSAFRQGFDAGAKYARLKGREADPEWHELQRWALEQSDRAEAAEATLALTETSGRVDGSSVAESTGAGPDGPGACDAQRQSEGGAS